MSRIKLLMVDNYDSFTYNIVQYFGELGAEVEVFRNDDITLEGIAARSDFDLSQHQKHSGKQMDVFDEALKIAAAKLPKFTPGAGFKAAVDPKAAARKAEKAGKAAPKAASKPPAKKAKAKK